MTSQEYLQKFETYLLTEKRVAKNTFDAYRRDLEQLAEFLAPQNISIDKVNPEHLKAFLKALKTGGMTARSMARKISCFKTFFAYLQKFHGIENATQQLITPKLTRTLPQHLAEKEIERLFLAAEQDSSPVGVRNKVMLYLLYVSGARIGELVNIYTEAIDFSAGIIKLAGKGGKERIVPLTTDMTELLKEYLEHAHPALVERDGLKASTNYLFPTFYGQKLRPVTRQLFWMYLKRLAEQATIRRAISPHQLRHSLATHLLKKGADLRSLQLLLGHEQLTTIQIYTHMETSHLRKIYDEKHPRA